MEESSQMQITFHFSLMTFSCMVAYMYIASYFQSNTENTNMAYLPKRQVQPDHYVQDGSVKLQMVRTFCTQFFGSNFWRQYVQSSQNCLTIYILTKILKYLGKW